jgi:uncharacterized membrane-anchored protein
MFSKTFLIFGFITIVIAPAFAQKPDSGLKSNVLKGPAKAHLDSYAEINVPAGYVFIDGKGTRALLKAKGEPSSGHEVGLLVSTNESWSVFFKFSSIGYVKDDDKDKLDPDKLLDSIKRGTAEANKERERAGNPPLEIVGWEVPPKYDSTTHNLEWAIRATSEGRPLLNYNTRLLGRKGVMEVVLVVDPEKLPQTLPVFKNLLTGYTFSTGQTYAEYRPGDKVAKYGLAALVLGGAAVGAAKLGLLGPLLLFIKKAWKLVVVAVAAVAASIKKFFAKLFGRKNESGMGHQP